jgi:exonuclease VII small subunit
VRKFLLLLALILAALVAGPLGCGGSSQQRDAADEAENVEGSEVSEVSDPGPSRDIAPRAPSTDPPPSSQAGEPYKLAVLLRFSDDPVFTRFFVDSIRRQVRDQLANYFAGLAEVRVDTSDSLQQELEAKSIRDLPPEQEANTLRGLLQKLEASGLRDLSIPPAEFLQRNLRHKVFLTVVEFREGLYRVRWRQLDGDVQHIGPEYSETTPDRQWLAKAICLAIKEDFAPVAVVEPIGDGSEAQLAFRGAEHGDRLAAWLEAGCVLKPFWVIGQQDGSVACQPMPYTALVIARDKNAHPWTKATVITGRTDPWRRTARVNAFKAIKLTTRRGRFRLRLLNAHSEDDEPVRTMVYASSMGFGDTKDRIRLEPDRRGYVVPPRNYQFDQVAYLTLRENKEFKLLLPITQPLVEREWRIPVDKDAGEKSNWRRKLYYCVQDLQAIQTLMDQCIGEVNQLNQNKHYEKALETVQQAVGPLDDLMRLAADDVRQVEAEAERVETSGDSLLVWVLGRSAELRNRLDELRALAADLDDTIRRLDAQSRAKVALKLAREAEQEKVDIDEAIARYEEALAALKECEDPGLQQVERKLAELRDWNEPKSPEHERARQFVFQRYAQSSVDDLTDSLLDDAQDFFEDLRDLRDDLAVTKLAKINGEHLGALAEIVEMLADRDSETDRAEQEKYRGILEKLIAFQKEVTDHLKSCAEGRPLPAASRAGEDTEAEEKPETEEEPQPEQETGETAASDRQEPAQPDMEPASPEGQTPETEQSPPGTGQPPTESEQPTADAKPPPPETKPQSPPAKRPGGPPDLGIEEEEEAPIEP